MIVSSWSFKWKRLMANEYFNNRFVLLYYRLTEISVRVSSMKWESCNSVLSTAHTVLTNVPDENIFLARYFWCWNKYSTFVPISKNTIDFRWERLYSRLRINLWVWVVLYDDIKQKQSYIKVFSHEDMSIYLNEYHWCHTTRICNRFHLMKIIGLFLMINRIIFPRCSRESFLNPKHCHFFSVLLFLRAMNSSLGLNCKQYLSYSIKL